MRKKDCTGNSWAGDFSSSLLSCLEIVKAGTPLVSLPLSLSLWTVLIGLWEGKWVKTLPVVSRSRMLSVRQQKWLPSARPDSNIQRVSGWDISCSVDVTCHSSLPPLITSLASQFILFQFRMHLYSLTLASSNSFCLLKMALNYAVMTGGMEVDGLSVSCPDHNDSDFVAGGQWVAVMMVAIGQTWGWMSWCYWCAA